MRRTFVILALVLWAVLVFNHMRQRAAPVQVIKPACQVKVSGEWVPCNQITLYRH